MMDEEIKGAIERIARSSDGRLLYRYLQRVALEVSASTEIGTLQAHHGRRSFAHELKRLMEEASDAAELMSGRRDIANRIDPDEPVVGRRIEPVERVRRGIERRVPADPEPA